MFLLKSALAGERLKISSQPKFILKGNCLKTKLRIVWSLKPTSGKKVIACVHAEVAFILKQLIVPLRLRFTRSFSLLILFVRHLS